jgi:hypothetical protein
MPADQRLRQSDVIDEVADAGRALGQATDDAEAVDIGERLVDRAELAQLGGNAGDRRDGGPDSGA